MARSLLPTVLVLCFGACSVPDLRGAPRLARLRLGLDAGGSTLSVDSIEDLGQFSAPASVIGRDGTTAALVGGRLLWTFGDTFVTHPNPIDGSGLVSATAGWSSVADPLRLEEFLDDAGDPTQFIPYTAAEITENRSNFKSGVALWPGAVLPTTDAGAEVLFQHVLRAFDGGGFAADAIGTAEVVPGDAQATRDPEFLFQHPEALFGIGGVTIDGGFAYLYDCEQVQPLNYSCKVARAPLGSVSDRSTYVFWNGGAWSPDISEAAWFIDDASYEMSVEWSPFISRWLAVFSVPLSNDIALRTADRITGPWSPAVIVPGSRPGLVTSGAGINYLARQHAELSSSDGRDIVISYAHPL